MTFTDDLCYALGWALVAGVFWFLLGIPWADSSHRDDE